MKNKVIQPLDSLYITRAKKKKERQDKKEQVGHASVQTLVIDCASGLGDMSEMDEKWRLWPLPWQPFGPNFSQHPSRLPPMMVRMSVQILVLIVQAVSAI